MKEQKVGLTTTNWILSILGILVLSCFIILPPVFRNFLKEEVVEEPPKEEVIVGTTVCQNQSIPATDYTDNVTLTFTYENQKIKGVIKNTVRTYSDSLVYQERKLTYGKLVTAFSIISGYEYSATPEDDTSSVLINEEYDLANFKPTTIVVPGDENPTAITTDYQLNDDISKVKEYLISNGYTCRENSVVSEDITQ